MGLLEIVAAADMGNLPNVPDQNKESRTKDS